MMKVLTIIFAFTQNRNPRESCLSSLEDEELEEFLIIMNRFSPLFIVISDVEKIGSAPRATDNFHTIFS